MKSTIRLRYAPSPTGDGLHIGNARTALFNYLFACRYKGCLIIRIEDTDLVRHVTNSEMKQLSQLKWLGIKWVEGPDIGGLLGPYRQSERLHIYQKYTKILLDKGLAYKEYQQDSINKFVVRFKVPLQQKYEFDDLIRGRLCFESKDIEDWIIIKENGYPTYNYAAAIDDYLMQISHVLRGEEHITNTPKQIMIYQAFGWQIPFFAHMSLILNENKKKLSKRDTSTDQFVEKYIDLGYLPESLFNFLFLLGFSPKSNQTIFSSEEIIALFNQERFIKSSAVFDVAKLSFINKQHLRNMPFSELVDKANFFLKKSDIFLKFEWLTKMILLFKDRIHYIKEIVDLYYLFFKNENKITEDCIAFLRINKGVEVANFLYHLLNKLDNLESYSIKMIVDKLAQQLDINIKTMFRITRIVCTHKKYGPDLFVYLELLGKKKVLNNIQSTLVLNINGKIQ
ncbi:glutamate--tRNA ligase [Candidatus Phytoplasma melaleucae]|uniref:Glutamate--tRNA ligase n=1 Tax=Candidatus Phytoplasma melaleucae TaxID=2982630 RepID=A0ABT9DFK3_9MOLU|nr:glutamate--tRNA ligase ['Melaleuca sp.' phytoplasma]MDO8168190.1 glutamate--tRNA ligase ['Melaleuca sp.' phytoplasma]